MSTTTDKIKTKSPAAKPRAQKASSGEAPRLKPGETFDEFHARVWNFVHDAYARAREAEEKEQQQP